MDVLTYNKVGPKNEVYLNPGQAVAFKLQVDNSKLLSDSLLPISLDIGAKTITGKAATLVAAVVSGGSTTDSALTIATGTKVTLSTCTAMYRSLTLNRSMLTEENGKKYLYLEKNGRTYYWKPDTYSIAQYAYTQLGKTGISTELQALCAELLRYGATAQIFKDYRTDALADRDMTVEHRDLWQYQCDSE